MKKINILILSLIFIFGFSLRFYKITEFPPSLNWDEISQGYNAYSILKTGTDEWGMIPLTNFRAYGDYPTTFYLYSLVPIEAIFGLNEFSVRLPSVIFGSLLILTIYGLAKIIFKKEELGLLVAFLVALSPWSFLLSRQAIQVIPALFLLSSGLLFWLKNTKQKYFLIGTILICLSAYAYHNTKILAPIILSILLFTNRKNYKKEFFLFNIAIAIIFLIPIFISILSAGSARATWVGILDEGSANRINELRSNSNLPLLQSRIVYNKLTYFLEVTAVNYLNYFSPRFLGLQGGTQYQFNIPNFGLVSLPELLFFYLGLFLLISKIKKTNQHRKLLLILLFLTPIPAAITRDPSQVVRAALMIIPVYLVIGFGFWSIIDFLKSKNLKKIVLVIFLLSVTVLFVRYITNFLSYTKDYSFAWQYGYKEIASYIKDNGNLYKKIFITKKYGEPHEFLLFYLQYDPKKFKSDSNLNRYFRSDWYWVDSFDKFVFLNDWEVKMKAECQMKKEKCLLITSLDNYPEGSRLLKTINFLNGLRAFDILELP